MEKVKQENIEKEEKMKLNLPGSIDPLSQFLLKDGLVDGSEDVLGLQRVITKYLEENPNIRESFSKLVF